MSLAFKVFREQLSMSAGLGRGWSHVWVSVLCVALTACSTAPKSAEDVQSEKQAQQVALQEKVDAKLVAADAAIKSGNAEQAMNHLDEAIKLDPASKQPWLKKSQFHFEKRQYGVAITEAQEALQRDVSDNTARSILAVSGLRVSAEALEQLRKANEVTGSARSEAESVAKIIREALGESILVPPAAASAAEAKPVARTASRPAPRPVAQAAPSASTTPSGGVLPVVAKANAASAASPVNPANLPAPAAGATVKPRPAPAPAGNGRSNPCGALQ
jgi:tetratricopeptide (TPR) repeat protein